MSIPEVKRWTTKRKNQLVLEILKGKTTVAEAVGQLIEKKFGINLSVWTVGRYLRRWGFMPQKPLKRAYEQNPKEVKAWLEKEYPNEYLNQDVKTNAVGRRRKRSLAEMEGNVRSYMLSTQKQPEIVKKYFHVPKVKYALD